MATVKQPRHSVHPTLCSSPGAYDCRQAPNNVTNPGQLGDRYIGCMVETRMTPAGAEAPNGYSMHRAALTVPAFTYGGACRITVTEVGARIRGQVACGQMVQTLLEGASRNPVDAAVSADVNGEFFCDLVKQ